MSRQQGSDRSILQYQMVELWMANGCLKTTCNVGKVSVVLCLQEQELITSPHVRDLFDLIRVLPQKIRTKEGDVTSALPKRTGNARYTAMNVNRACVVNTAPIFVFKPGKYIEIYCLHKICNWDVLISYNFFYFVHVLFEYFYPQRMFCLYVLLCSPK